jgi:hypothetical protein
VYRARVRAGTCLAWAELRPEVGEVLLDQGLVAPEETEDRHRRGAALAALAERWLRQARA